MLTSGNTEYLQNWIDPVSSTGNLNNKKGFSMLELLVSTIVLAILMMGVAGFSTSFFDVSATSAKQLLNVNQAREIARSISGEIRRADYIYPSGVTISLEYTDTATGLVSGIDINTTSSPSMLFSENVNGDTLYGFVAYFIKADDNGTANLYQFIQGPAYDWEKDSSPAESLKSFNGAATKIVSDIDMENTKLAYILNYSDGITDKVLQGQLSNTPSNNVDALIKGIEWQIVQNNIENQTIRVKGLSGNVPRFIE
jgi:prepilin-type N-terminal cleavage/methylation domain-containing protein